MDKSIRNKILQRSFTSQWKPRTVDYFAVCGLGVEDRRVDTEGRFHTTCTARLAPSDAVGHQSEPFTPQLIDRHPPDDHRKFELPRMLPSVVLPYGVQVYGTGPSPEDPESMPRAFPVILTDTKGVKMYVAALRFRDRLDSFLTRQHKLPEDSYADKCLCIVSHFPFLDAFQGMLSELHRLCFQEAGCSRPLWDIIEELLHIPLPQTPDIVHSFSIHSDCYRISLPEDMNPCLPHVSYQALAESLSISNILKLFAVALVERKILLKGASLALLTDVAEALVSLLHPLKWMPVYVPVLPVDALECLDAPVTYIYGVCSADVDIDLTDLDKVVLADLDSDAVEMVYAEGRQPTEKELKDYTMCGIPELPQAPAQRLQRSLRHLLKPRVNSMMSVPHARSRQEAEDLDLQVGLSKEGWGPRHDERFQLAFLRFMAEALKGFQDFMVRTGSGDDMWQSQRVGDIFRGKEFLADRLERFGPEAKPFYELLLVTCNWSGFLADEAFEEALGSPMFAEIMAAVGTKDEAALKLPGKEEGKTVVELERGWFRPEERRVDFADCQDADEEVGGHFAWDAHTRFPESAASQLAEGRRQEAKMRLMKLDSNRLVEEQTRKELLRLNYMAKVHHYLDVLEQDPSDEESRGEIKQIIATSSEEGVPGDCVVTCMEERFKGQESVEFEQGFFNLCKELSAFSLDIFTLNNDYKTAASFFEVSGRVFLKGSTGQGKGPLNVRQELKDLDIWHEEKLWEHIFKLRVDNWERGDAPETKLQPMMQLVRAMGEVGLSFTEVGDLMEHLSGALSLKSQILLRDQFSQLQVLLHPKARMFVKMLEQGQKAKKLATNGLALSRSTHRWMSAVVRVRERVRFSSEA